MTRMTPMMKMIALWVVLGTFAGAAFAQPGAGSAPAAAPAGSAAASAAAPAADAPPAAGPASASVTPQDAADARKACTKAMNADPQFAADIIATQHDKDTIQVHTDAEAHVQKNEQHVIYAYAAMWIIAALFVIFLWRRQQALQAEIAILRRDLEAAAGEATADKARS